MHLTRSIIHFHNLRHCVLTYTHYFIGSGLVKIGQAALCSSYNNETNGRSIMEIAVIEEVQEQIQGVIPGGFEGF